MTKQGEQLIVEPPAQAPLLPLVCALKDPLPHLLRSLLPTIRHPKASSSILKPIFDPTS